MAKEIKSNYSCLQLVNLYFAKYSECQINCCINRKITSTPVTTKQMHTIEALTYNQ